MSRNATVYLVLSGLLIVLAFTRVLDDIGHERTEDALQRALATYAIARALNGVISVAQGTELAVEPGGIGVVFTPGEILDPINDLIERFSWIMLASSASLGIITVLLSISTWVWLSVVMSLCLVMLVYLGWKRDRAAAKWKDLVLKVAIVLVILRFAAPVMALVNDFVYLQFLDPRYQSAVSELEETRDKVVEINSQQPAGKGADNNEGSLIDQARLLYESATENIKRKLNLEQRMISLNDAATNASRAAIDLIVIFVFQTIILPVCFIAIIWYLLKQVFRQRLSLNRLIKQ